MLRRDWKHLGRWSALVATVGLLAFCLALLGAQAATAEGGSLKVEAVAEPLAAARVADSVEQLPAASAESAAALAERHARANADATPSKAASADAQPALLVSSGPPPEEPRVRRSVPPLDWGGEEYTPRTGGGAPALGPAGIAASSLSAPPMPSNADFAVCQTRDLVWGMVDPGKVVTVTVDGDQVGAALSDQNGFFWTTLYDDQGDRVDLAGGGSVRVYEEGAQKATVELAIITGTINTVSDVVSGSIDYGHQYYSVTVYTGWDEPARTSISKTVNTDLDGNFSTDLSGMYDFAPWHVAYVAYETSGVEVHRHVFPRNGLLVRADPINQLMGAAPPGTVLTATVYESDGVTAKISDTLKADSPGGWYRWNLVSPTEIAPGDIVEVKLSTGKTITREATVLTAYGDAINDTVTGKSAPGSTVRGLASTMTPAGWKEVLQTTVADGSGDYTLDYSGIADVAPGNWVAVFSADAEGEDMNYYGSAPSVEVVLDDTHVSGSAPDPFNPDYVGDVMSLTLKSTGQQYTTTRQGFGWYGFDQHEHGLPDFEPGEVITVEAVGWEWDAVVEVQTMTVEHDAANDIISGTVVPPSNRVEVHGWQYQSPNDAGGWLYPLGGFFDTPATASSPFAANLQGFDLRNAVDYEVRHRTADENTVLMSGGVDFIRAWPQFSGVIVRMGPAGTVYTVTLRSGGGVKDQFIQVPQENDGGSLFIPFSEGVLVEVNDRIEVESAAGFSQTVVIPEIVIEIDEVSDMVTGSAPANTLLYAHVDGEDRGFVPTDADGHFAVAVDQFQQQNGSGEVDRTSWTMVCYFDENANHVCRGAEFPQIYAQYEMDGRNMVFGNGAAPGSTLFITVTEPSDDVVFSGTVEAGSGWEGPSSYALDLPDHTVVPSNVVAVEFGEGEIEYVHVVTITGNADADSDIVTGTAPANGIVDAHVDAEWGGDRNINEIEVSPGGVYTADFGSEGWNIEYGDRFNIYYHAPNGHRVEYHFWLPMLDLGIDKWRTDGHAVPGGVYVYEIRYYNNDATGTAEGVLIVDTLPVSTTYAGDTSGFPHVQVGRVITWEVGDVEQWTEESFMLTVQVSDTVPLGDGVIEENCVQIMSATPGDRNDGDNQRCSDRVDVSDDDAVDMSIRKWSYPGDPTPGQEFEYHFDVCNERGAAVGPVRITDTLPTDVEFLWWRTEQDWAQFWNEIIADDDQLVLEAPGYPSRCDRIQVRVRLTDTATIGGQLHNHIEVYAEGDERGDNDTDDDYRTISGPRFDLEVNKWLNGGELVPGGSVYYGLDYENRGNSEVHAWLTDTFPAGATFESAFRWNWGTVEPYFLTDTYAVWDLGVLAVNERDNLNVDFRLDDGITPPQVITNRLEIGSKEVEDTPWNNEAVVATTIWEGDRPNLFVHKSIRSYEPGWDRIQYEYEVGNYGDEPVYGARLTDTFPLSTTLEWCNLNWWDGQIWTTETVSQFLVTFERIDPGRSQYFQCDARLDDQDARLVEYTNRITITTPPDDANPADNSAEATVVSGGEVREVDLRVYGDNIWGEVYDGPITITTPYTEVVFYHDGGFDWYAPDQILPGDTIIVAAGEGKLPVSIEVPDPFDAYASSITDTVWGQIDHLDHEEIQVDLRDGAGKNGLTDVDGYYSVAFYDIPRGGEGEVQWETEISYARVRFHRDFLAPDLVLRVRTGHEEGDVNSNYEAGHTVWLTVTDEADTETAWAQVTTTPDGGWGNSPGFATNDSDWQPGGRRPDILPGYKVLGRTDDGNTTEVEVGEITGVVDSGDNSISGQVFAGWFSQDLRVECHPWGAPHNVDSKDSTAGPDGDPPYFCQWDPGEWDIQPGQEIGVWYIGEDANWVGRSIAEPAAYLEIQKHAPGQPGEGSNMSFRVEYRNDGQANAENVIITDIMTGLAYVSDTTGFPHAGGSGASGDPIVWNLGTVPPGDWIQFYVFARVTEVQSNTITNTVLITTTSANGSEHHERDRSWNGHVWHNGTNLWVNKHAWTDDPAPGTEFVFQLQACNGGDENNTDSGAITMTDTLSDVMTVVDWWADVPGWWEVSRSPHQIVLSRPTIEQHHCWDVYLQVAMTDTVEPDHHFCNRVEITATNDSPGMKWQQWCGSVGSEHVNLHINKSMHEGVLVPGGRLRYGMNYCAGGNVPVAGPIRITDTLPVSTTFDSWEYGSGPMPTLVLSDAEKLVWEIPDLSNGFCGDLQLRLNIDPKAKPGTELVNEIEIAPQPDEDDYGDNTDKDVQEVFPKGPNLQVSKWHEWHDGTSRLQYYVEFENTGDEGVEPVFITDTYPENTEFHGNWGTNFWDNVDLISDDPGSRRLVWELERLNPGNKSQLNFQVDLTDTVRDQPLQWFTNVVTITTPGGDPTPGDNRHEDVAFSGGEVRHVELFLDPGGDGSMYGSAWPNTNVTVTLPYTEVYAWADGGCDGCWDVGNVGPITPGITIIVKAGAATQPVTIDVPDPFTAEVDGQADQVSGQIDGWHNMPVEVHGGWDGGYQETTTDGSGYFLADYDDIPRGQGGYVRYMTEVDYAEVVFHLNFYSHDLMVMVDYGHDWVNGNYEPGHRVWLTVTQASAISYTAVVTTGPQPDWGGSSGFSTQHDDWVPEQPDIEPGDEFAGLVRSDVYNTSLRVGEIVIVMNPDNDVVSGTIRANWLSPGLVTVNCEIHEENGQNITIPDVDPDEGEFRCDFAGMWDLRPEHSVAVNYVQSDGNMVQNHASFPTSSVYINKYATGNPGEGGNLSFRIEYNNDGDADAENVVITDTMVGLTYLADTLGLPPTVVGGSGPIVWNLGTVPSHTHVSFELFTTVDSGVGETISNTATITTSTPYDNGWPRESSWRGEVQAGDTHLWISKDAWTHDPAPGSEFVYTVDVCNGSENNTSSTEVTLTDTLPVSATLVMVWSDQEGWEQQPSTHPEVVLTRPTIEAHSCSQVYLKVSLTDTVNPGEEICNRAEITASNNLDPDNNSTEWCTNVGEERTNLAVSKEWNWGELVPGGELRYNIHYENNGNQPVSGPIALYDYPPDDVSYEAWSHQGGVAPSSFFIHPTFGYVYWIIDGLDAGYWGDIEIVLRVDDDAVPGHYLHNTAWLVPRPGEETEEDNTDIATEWLNDHGPNLRVTKQAGWHGHGEGRDAWYNITVENVGDEPVEHVVLTDTLAPPMSLNGDPWPDWDQIEDYDSNPHGFVLTFWEMGPGYRHDFGFDGVIPGSGLPDGGQILTNTIEIMQVPGEPTDDNFDQVVLTTGPDLWVEKKLDAGEVLPGKYLTFSIAFGNKVDNGAGWWQMQGPAVMTDTLPPELEYITSTQRWCGDTDNCPRRADVIGRDLVWDLWPLHEGEENAIWLTVKVTSTVEDGDQFGNLVKIKSEWPISDTEPYYGNNRSQVWMGVGLPEFEVTKVYDTDQVAGTGVVYTLTVANTGSKEGTGVTLSDTVPAGMSYSDSDGTWHGSFGAGDVTWDLGAIAASGSATAWFSGTLGCSTGAVTNEAYGVVASDQGVTSGPGAPVAFDIVAPTITADFTHTTDIVVSDTVHFTATAATDGTGLGYQWYMGEGAPFGGDLWATHVYTKEGLYEVVFTATDTCSFEQVAKATVKVNPPALEADFVPTDTTVLVNSAVDFTDKSTTDRPPITEWLWEFGDETTSTDQNPSHAYGATGSYTVTLTITDSLGYSDSKSVVNALEVAAPVLSVGKTYESNKAAGGVVTYTLAVTNTGNWPASGVVLSDTLPGNLVLGGTDGTAAGGGVTWSLASIGAGVMNTATAWFSGTLPCVGTITNDAYRVMTSTEGITTTSGPAVQFDVIAPTLVPTFTLSNSGPKLNELVDFASTSTTNGGGIVEWGWDFGDSSKGTGQFVSHAYTTPEAFTVTLTITDTCGHSEKVIKPKAVTITSVEIYLPIVVKKHSP